MLFNTQHLIIQPRLIGHVSNTMHFYKSGTISDINLFLLNVWVYYTAQSHEENKKKTCM